MSINKKNTLWYRLILEYYTTMRMNKPQENENITDLLNMMLRKAARYKRSIYCMIPLIPSSEVGKTT